MSSDPHWNEGYMNLISAIYDNKSVTENPYPEGTPENIAWEMGSIAAWNDEGGEFIQ